VHEGDIVLCRAGTPSHLVFDTSEGRTVTLERDWARFIQVAVYDPDLALPVGALVQQ
jgi:hypothetical protein